MLKIAENQLGSEGAIAIIKNADALTSLSLAKNLIKSEVGKHLAQLLKRSETIQKLNLEYNELEMVGTR